MEDLISKKDLLLEAGISYGQLYRWKRKGLIPEDWFVRKSTFTGQETFFPRDKVLVRIRKIQAMKGDDLSLDDIADAVAPDLTAVSLAVAEVSERGLIAPEALEVWRTAHPDADTMRHGDLLAAYVLEGLLRTGEITAAEGAGVIEVIEENHAACEGKECDLLFVRKMGTSVLLLAPASAELSFESAARVVARVALNERIGELAERLG